MIASVVDRVDFRQPFAEDNRVLFDDTFNDWAAQLLVPEYVRDDNSFPFQGHILERRLEDPHVVKQFLGNSSSEIARHTFTLPRAFELLKETLAGDGPLLTGEHNLFYLDTEGDGLFVLFIYCHNERSAWHVRLTPPLITSSWAVGSKVFIRISRRS